MSGIFITFEGPEGAGKTTQLRLLKEFLEEQQIPYLSVREPGGTRIGQRVRDLLLDPELTEMAVLTELFLYSASRAQLVSEKIAPALKKGMVVICDRYIDSTYVYQGIAGKVDQKMVEQINRFAVGSYIPDRTYLLDIPWEEGEKRLQQRGQKKDRMELKEKIFHQQVREGYLQLLQRETKRILLVDATKSEQEISATIREDFQRNLLKVNGAER